MFGSKGTTPPRSFHSLGSPPNLGGEFSEPQLLPGAGGAFAPCFEAVGAGIYFQNVGQDILEWRVVNSRSFVDAIAGVKAYLFRWNSAQTVVDGFYENGSASVALYAVQCRISKKVRKEWIVDLQQ